jgi:ribose 5-phosphate isomerase A
VIAAKERAARAAVDRIQSGMVIGLGTGSTTNIAIEEIGRRLAAGELRDIQGVPTSLRTAALAREHGIPLTSLEAHPVLDLTIDGADEVDPAGNMIKGHGGALLREKIVASCSRRLVIAVDERKLVKVLGETRSLPIEVVEFGWNTHLDVLREMNAEPTLRLTGNGEPYRTDEGNVVIDARFAEGIKEPRRVDAQLRARAGVVETGLFLGFDPEVVVGRES